MVLESPGGSNNESLSGSLVSAPDSAASLAAKSATHAVFSSTSVDSLGSLVSDTRSKGSSALVQHRVGPRPKSHPNTTRFDIPMTAATADVPLEKPKGVTGDRRHRTRGISSVRMQRSSRSGNVETFVSRRATSEVLKGKTSGDVSKFFANYKVRVADGDASPVRKHQTQPGNKSTGLLHPFRAFLKGRRRRNEERNLDSEMEDLDEPPPFHGFDEERTLRTAGQSTRRKLVRAATLRTLRKVSFKEAGEPTPEPARTLSREQSKTLQTRSASMNPMNQLGRCFNKPVLLQDDPYRVLEVEGTPIGEGSSGSVYKSRTPNGQVVALKVIEHPTDEDFNEVTVMQQVTSSHLMRCYMSFRWEGSLYVAMDLMDRGSVFDRLQALERTKRFLSEKCIAYILQQLLLAIRALHDENIVHGDLKPDNLLISDKGFIRLADFGSAVFYYEGSLQKCRTGTPHWMAPEVARLEPVTPKADLWSVGICAFELAEFEPPLMCMPRDQVIDMLANNRYPQPTMEVRRSFLCQDFIYQCTEPDVQRRPSVTDLLMHPFISQLDDVEDPRHLLSELCPDLTFD